MPAEDIDPVVQVRRRRSSAGQDETVHVSSPRQRFNKITGGQETINETHDSKPIIVHPEDDGGEYRVPILASDETAKEVGADSMQAAISPRFDRRAGSYDYHDHRSGDVTPTSRPSSRPGSIYGLHSASHSLSRFISHHDDRETMHTPLEDVHEYEPLFPDEESKQKALSHAERFKQRPDALKHRFPSQDIWEDAPSSVNYTTMVSTPELEKQAEMNPSAAFEPPALEAARRGETSEEEKKKLIPAEERLAKSRFAPHLRDDMPTRPGMQPRFPSRDIWEDSPDSYHLSATVGSPPVEDTPEDDEPKPTVPPRPAGKSRLGEGASSSQAAPSIPARPAKKVYSVPPVDAKLTDASTLAKLPSPTELKKVPSIPDRPKPQVPPRPAKKTSADSLSKTISPDSVDNAETEKYAPIISPPVTKAKPQVPARPATNAKFAGLKGNFMNDLNQKLGLGPPKEKEKEPEPDVEAKPLEDARKGRARGPQRRAPAKSPAAAPVAASAPAHSFYKPQSLWHIDDDGLLNIGSLEGLDQAKAIESLEEDSKAAEAREEKVSAVPSAERVEAADHAPAAENPTSSKLGDDSKAEFEQQKRPDHAPAPLAPSLATNTAGEPADPTLGTPGTEKSNPLSRNSPAVVKNGEILTRESTESATESTTGGALEREDPNPDTDVIPASKQTTASTHGSGASLERKATNPPEEDIELRDEQLKASAPGRGAKPDGIDLGDAGKTEATVTKEATNNTEAGADTPKEPMPEKDVSYAQLEAMQKKADGMVQHPDGEEHGDAKV